MPLHSFVFRFFSPLPVPISFLLVLFLPQLAKERERERELGCRRALYSSLPFCAFRSLKNVDGCPGSEKERERGSPVIKVSLIRTLFLSSPSIYYYYDDDDDFYFYTTTTISSSSLASFVFLLYSFSSSIYAHLLVCLFRLLLLLDECYSWALCYDYYSYPTLALSLLILLPAPLRRPSSPERQLFLYASYAFGEL